MFCMTSPRMCSVGGARSATASTPAIIWRGTRTGPSGSRCLRIERWPAVSATTGWRGDSVGVAPAAIDATRAN